MGKIVIHCCCKQKIRPLFKIGPITEAGYVTKTPELENPRPKKAKVKAMILMSSSQQCNVSVVFTDKKGNPAVVDGVPEWSTDNSEVLALTPSLDGLSCLVAAVGPLGSASITLHADADLGSGTKSIVGTLEFEINAGEAVTVALTPGTPTEQP